MARSDLGGAQVEGLYDGAHEHDACGIGMVADLQGRATHHLVAQAMTVNDRLAHRGASGAEANTGDGSGILLQVPHRFLADVAADAGFDLPEPGHYVTGLAFLPKDDRKRRQGKGPAGGHRRRRGTAGARVAGRARRRLGARRDPRRAQPHIEQVFLVPTQPMDPMALERLAFVVRKRAEHTVDDLSFPSLSARTLVYKGMLTPGQLGAVLPRARRRAGRVWAGARPLAVLDQHLPQLAARPPLPLPRPQRRDQHGGR